MPAPIKVELVPHSADWQQKATDAAHKIKQALGANCITVHHIGSTSIPGICAKPIIDLMPEVQSLEQLDALKQNMLDLGFQWWGEYGIANRRFCTLSEPHSQQRLFNVHCFETGDEQIARHLAFRDYLRSNAEIAKQYEEEKKRCRALHPDDSHAYTDAKAEWIAAQLPKALAFFESGRNAR